MKSDIRDAADWNGKRLAHFNTEKSKIVLVDRPNNSIAIDVGMDEFILEINSSFKILGLPFSSELDWGPYIDSIVKTVSKKIETLNSCMKFLSPQVAFCFFKPTIRPCMRHCFHVSAGASRCLVQILDQLHQRIFGTVALSTTTSLEPLVQWIPFIFGFFQYSFLYTFHLFFSFFSYNSMPFSGRSSLHEMNPNQKKRFAAFEDSKQRREKFIPDY